MRALWSDRQSCSHNVSRKVNVSGAFLTEIGKTMSTVKVGLLKYCRTPLQICSRCCDNCTCLCQNPLEVTVEQPMKGTPGRTPDRIPYKRILGLSDRKSIQGTSHHLQCEMKSPHFNFSRFCRDRSSKLSRLLADY